MHDELFFFFKYIILALSHIKNQELNHCAEMPSPFVTPSPTLLASMASGNVHCRKCINVGLMQENNLQSN